MRYARSAAPTIGKGEGRDITRAEILREGHELIFLTVGPCAAAALEAAEQLALDGFNAGVVDARFVKPLDTAMLDALAHKAIVTVEENVLCGGFGSAVLEYYAKSGQLRHVTVSRVGLDDIYGEQASRDEQLREHGLDARGLYAVARRILTHVRASVSK